MARYVMSRLPSLLFLAVATAALVGGLFSTGSSATGSSVTVPQAVTSTAVLGPVAPAPVETDTERFVSLRPFRSSRATTDRLPALPPASQAYAFIWPARGAISGGMTAKHPRGIDIAANLGDAVTATRGGKVTFAGGDVCCVYGLFVIVQHDDGWSSLYAHLNSLLVKPGDRVEQGDLLGPAGNTGKAYGVHLHFELLRFGVPVNPLDQLNPLRSYTPVYEPLATVGRVDVPERNAEPTPEPTIEAPEPVAVGASAGDAIAAARRWMTQQGEGGYEVDHASCFAIASGPNWSVSCAVTPWGCEGAECRSFLEACVIGSQLLVEAACSGY